MACPSTPLRFGRDDGALRPGKFVLRCQPVMEDMRGPSGRGSLRRLMQRRSTIAFLLTLPLITLMIGLVAYPTGFAIYLSLLDRTTTRFVGLGNFAYLIGRDRFWMALWQTCLFAITTVVLKSIIGFVAAHLMHNIPTRGQRKWRGMLLVPWVIPPTMSILAWRELYDPSFGAFNWVL